MTGPYPIRLPLSGRSALLTYEPYYGLKEKPFSLSVDPQFLYKSRSHAPIFDDLLAGIRRREGLIVLTGDIGTGKTMLCRAVLENLDRKTFSAFVPDPFVSREDLLKMLLIDFGVMDVEDLKSGRLNGASRPDLSYPLYDFLSSLVPLQAFAVVIIDEAQNLSASLLEEIRILSDLQAPEKLLQVVLVGQLELRAKLKLPEMRQVDQRVSVRCDLEPLDLEAVASYIAHRLHVAGGTPDRVSFGPPAIDLIAERSGGVPRLINLICDRSLHRGHLARTSLIDTHIVRVAMIDLGLAGSLALQIPAALQEAIVFEERDSPAADRVVSQEPPAPAPAPVEPDWKEPLLDVSEDDASPLAPRHWSSRSKGLVFAAIFVAMAGSAWFGRAQWKEGGGEIMTVPQPPPSPLESFALNFVPKRRPAKPPAPAAPAPGSFAIDVALFSSRATAARLAGELAAESYRAYVRDLNLGDRGHLFEVTAGPFASREAAEAGLARIHAIPGYKDARVMSSGP